MLDETVVNLSVKDIAEYWKCSPMLAKKKLERAGASIVRVDGVAVVKTTKSNPVYQWAVNMQIAKAEASHA